MLTAEETAREVARCLGRDPESRATARLAADLERFSCASPMLPPKKPDPNYDDGPLTDAERNA
jgi:hypothetical protein